ncbi:MAG: arginase family protein [Desulfotomaculum sp.]|nr:arginase family protein [Desulfotomaculum sp.]
MGLLYDKVTFLNFDQTYTPQKSLRRFSQYWIDLNNIPHTNCYCEKSSLQRIKYRLKSCCQKGVTFIGSGNYHYVTLLLLYDIQEPFTLILLDNHTDMSPNSSSNLVSCGSWVSYAIDNLQLLKKVIIIGATKSQKIVHSDLSAKVKLFSQSYLNPSLLSLVLSEIETDSVYISIDKDVLNKEEAVTNWDQGEMPLSDLLKLVKQIKVHKKVYGIDICGELPYSPVNMLQQSYSEAININENTNITILKSILS